METAQLLFNWTDYILFGMMLAISIAIGLYFGFYKKQKTTEDYIHGGKTMGTFPVAISLIASSISGTTMLGAPSEVYTHGGLYWVGSFSVILVNIIVHCVYLPVFFNLQLTSSYEYLELRFSHEVRKMASFFFALSLVLFVPIIMYVPSLAFAYATGFSVYMISPLICIICIFYTTVGGLKAVIWTDFVQGFVLVGASVALIVIGIVNLGGFAPLFEVGWRGGRLDLAKFDPSPLERNTVWTVVVGTTFNWVSKIGASQDYMQKFLSTPSVKAARSALFYFAIGTVFMHTITCLIGLIIYASYHECDPKTAGAIEKNDQLLPYFVMKTASNFPGLLGIFIAGVFSASLSTMSSSLNALSATLFEDFVKPCLAGRRRLEERTNLIMKAIVVLVGALCVLLVLLVEKLGAILELANSVAAITGGALLGLFTLGMFFPWANTKGAVSGCVSSILFVGWLVVGAQVSMRQGHLPHPPLPVSVAGCAGGNGTSSPAFIADVTRQDGEPAEVFFLYRIAFFYFCAIGAIWVVVVGLAVSFLTGPRDPRLMRRDLFVTFAHKYVTFDRAGDEVADPAERVQLTTQTGKDASAAL